MTNRKQAIIIAALIIITFAARIIPGPRTIDDAFITFRYSRSIVEGDGFVYNPGEYTLGTTTPLFTLMLSAVSKITGGEDFQWYAIVLSAAADAITVALIFLIAQTVIENIWIAALPALLWAIAPMSVTFAIGGMETSVNILWMVLATWLYVTRRDSPRAQIGMGICAALGILTRVDAVLWIAPLFLYQLIAGWRAASTKPILQRIPWRTWVAGVIVMLPWLIFSVAYFHALIPNSVTAKRYVYLVQPGEALVRLIQTYSTPFFEFDAFGSVGTMIAAVVYIILSIFALIYIVRRLPRLLPFLIYPWIYFAFFSILNPLMFRWYLAPPMPALMLTLTVGAWALVARPRRSTNQPARSPRTFRFASIIVGIIGVVWIATSLNAWAIHPEQGPDRPAPTMAWNALELLYEQMGEHLYNDLKVTPTTRVASADIGTIGYFSRATIVDTIGLVTPELTRYYPIDPSLIASDQNYAIPPQLIYDTKPDYLVTMEGFVRAGLAKQQQFADEYHLITAYPFNVYGTAMQLYQKQ